MDNYSRKFHTGKSSYATRRRTSVVSPWKPSSVYVHSTTSTPKESQVKKLFEEHKPIFLGVSGFLIIVLIIIIFYCYRRCCEKDKKQLRKPSSTNHTLSMSHEEFHLPRWKKSAVQPRQGKQKEIKELGTLHFTLKYDLRR